MSNSGEGTQTPPRRKGSVRAAREQLQAATGEPGRASLPPSVPSQQTPTGPRDPLEAPNAYTPSRAQQPALPERESDRPLPQRLPRSETSSNNGPQKGAIRNAREKAGFPLQPVTVREDTSVVGNTSRRKPTTTESEAEIPLQTKTGREDEQKMKSIRAAMQMAGFPATQQDTEQVRPAPGTESARQPANNGPVEESRTASTERDKGSQGDAPRKGSIRVAREKSGLSMPESRNRFPVIPSPSSSPTAEWANPGLSASSSDEQIKASVMAARDNGGFLTQQPSYSPQGPAPVGQSADSPQTRGPIRAARQKAGVSVEPVQAQRPFDSSTQLRSPLPAQLRAPPLRSNLQPSPRVAGDHSLPKGSMRAAREGWISCRSSTRGATTNSKHTDA
ncbi:hypothetical protein LTS18_004218 [Coniosporium uncinatum]|uniref:Uncharacterized protein n=1 Tax=Coniosporium uncinatum TaxID=93489 RepID=A0ACC3D680_9PEZI|nr:hypothetical protein LTS18_004218 [Coniosporium uncinatum]